MANTCTAHIDELLRELFEDSEEQIIKDRITAEHMAGTPSIPGLTFIPQYLSKLQQKTLLQQVEATGWFSNSDNCSSNRPKRCSNQAMVFGVSNLPHWLLQLGQQLPLHCYWPHELSTRQPVFDTAIVNQYMPGDGITAHVDLMRFSDGIAIMSLGGPAIMTFAPVQPPTCKQQEQQQPSMAALQQQNGDEQQQVQQQVPGCEFHKENSPNLCQPLRLHGCCCQPVNGANTQQPVGQPQQQLSPQQHQLLLQGGDLLLLHGEARYYWSHGIAAVKEEVLLCKSCKAKTAGSTIAEPAAKGYFACRTDETHTATAAASVPFKTTTASAAPAAGAVLDCQTSAAASSFSTTAAAEDIAYTTAGVQAAADSAGLAAGAGGPAVVGYGGRMCQQCVRIVRGKRVSITLRRLDPEQTVLDMQ